MCEDKNNDGAMFMPIILGNDKTTVSVATGQNKFYRPPHPLQCHCGDCFPSNSSQYVLFKLQTKFTLTTLTNSLHSNSGAPRFRNIQNFLPTTNPCIVLCDSQTRCSRLCQQYKVNKCCDGHFAGLCTALLALYVITPTKLRTCALCPGWCPV